MRPVVIVNPRRDDGFVQRVNELVGAVGAPAELQSRLRDAYPDAIVRRRELSSESTEVWYVYRDGRWTPDQIT